MIPPKEKQEWKDLIKGKIKPDITSFSLQMKLNTLTKTYSKNLISLDSAVNELFELCEKYEKIYKADLDKIFK